MLRIRRRFKAAAVAALLLATFNAFGSAAASELPPSPTLPSYLLRPGQRIDVGGYRLNMYCMGTGSPTVVMDAGLGWGAYAWATVQQPIASFTRVCSYDRAGYGFSDMGPLPRTSLQISRELKRLLDGAHIAPPYVLVGWSFGGMNVRLYADRYRASVAGLVLVDPSHENMGQFYPRQWLNGAKSAEKTLASCARAARSGSLTPQTKTWAGCAPYVFSPQFPKPLKDNLTPLAQKPDNYITQLSEFSNLFTTSAQELRETNCFYGNMPLEILHAGKQPKDAASADFDPHYLDLIKHEALTSSDRGELLIVAGAGHDIQIDQPQIVIDAVRHVVEDTKHQPSDKYAIASAAPHELKACHD